MTAAAITASRAEVRASSVFAALLRRDMRVARRELPFFLLRTTMQPLMFVIVFGYLMPKMGFMGRDYTTALLREYGDQPAFSRSSRCAADGAVRGGRRDEDRLRAPFRSGCPGRDRLRRVA